MKDNKVNLILSRIDRLSGFVYDALNSILGGASKIDALNEFFVI